MDYLVKPLHFLEKKKGNIKLTGLQRPSWSAKGGDRLHELRPYWVKIFLTSRW